MRGALPPLASKIAEHLPLTPLEVAMRHLIRRALAIRPGFSARLSEYAGKRFCISPTDCPFSFVITPHEDGADVETVRDGQDASFDARIKAPLIVLMGMVDGTYDGDALFFSRDLMIEGDTSAVLALRNALEDAEFDPGAILGLPEPATGPFNRAFELAFAEVRKVLGAPAANGPATSRMEGL